MPTPRLTAKRVVVKKNTPEAMLRGRHHCRTFGAGPVMGFSGKIPKSEFRPRWKSKVGIPTLVQSKVGIPTSGGAGSAGWLRCRAGGAAGWRLLCRAGGAPGWRLLCRQGCGALGVEASALSAGWRVGIEASTLSAGWRGSDAGQVARQRRLLCRAGGAAGLQCRAQY